MDDSERGWIVSSWVTMNFFHVVMAVAFGGVVASLLVVDLSTDLSVVVAAADVAIMVVQSRSTFLIGPISFWLGFGLAWAG